jgi:hypothetical protein
MSLVQCQQKVLSGVRRSIHFPRVEGSRDMGAVCRQAVNPVPRVEEKRDSGGAWTLMINFLP